jgi:tRNA (guanine-N7-)-methyltransferase
MDNSETKTNIYRSSRQGGVRYDGIIQPDGSAFPWDFEEAFFMEGTPIWQALDLAPFKPADMAEVFPNGGPLNIEIGMGNGEFVSHYASAAPASNWMGFEVFHKVFEKAVRRVRRLELKNVRLIQFDAEFFVRLLPNASVQGFYVNFPDPWPKARHNKRRLLKPWFIEMMRDKLLPEGTITIATDHRDYAEEITANIAQVEGIQSLQDGIVSNDMGDYYKTKYYRKFAANSVVYFYKFAKQ